MAAPPQIIAIDDDQAICALLQELLCAEGYRAEAYLDGPTALGRLAEGGVELVFLDWMMPEISGAEILSRIRTMPDHPPVIILTAAGELAVPTPPPGAVAVLQKPFALDHLLAYVRYYCQPPAAREA